MNVEAWKRRARQLSAQSYVLYLAYRHPRTPWYAKVVAVLVVGYVFSPIDPIPDFIPGVGLLDEMVVVPIGILIATKCPIRVLRGLAVGDNGVSKNRNTVGPRLGKRSGSLKRNAANPLTAIARVQETNV
jgi:uncharacterized membrane protein YkvA (DUF1232 family)